MNRQIYDEASGWLVELRVGDIDAPARERLDAWFRASPEHLRAFLELSSLWEAAGDPDTNCARSVEDLIARAKSSTNVVPWEGAPPNTSMGPSALPSPLPVSAEVQELRPLADKPRLPRRNFLTRYGVAASLALVALAGATLILYAALNPTYATSTGEQRTVQLPDGTVVELNARSRIRVRFTERERHIDLLAGQALFKVAKNPARPFIVSSEDTRVRAVGTEFDVYRKAEGTTVTVVEGRVSVTPGNAGDTVTQVPFGLPGSAKPESTAVPLASTSVLVSAGEQVVATPANVTKPARTDVAAATAWRQRELVFDSTPLTDVVLEFNRYNQKPLIVTDERLRGFHVTGVFSSTDPTSLLRFLRAQPDIEVSESESEIRIAHR